METIKSVAYFIVSRRIYFISACWFQLLSPAVYCCVGKNSDYIFWLRVKEKLKFQITLCVSDFTLLYGSETTDSLSNSTLQTILLIQTHGKLQERGIKFSCVTKYICQSNPLG